MGKPKKTGDEEEKPKKSRGSQAKPVGSQHSQLFGKRAEKRLPGALAPKEAIEARYQAAVEDIESEPYAHEDDD